MPKSTKSAAEQPTYLPSSTLVLDNGGYSLKAGFAPNWPSADNETLRHCRTVPNALARTRDKRVYIASQLDAQISQWNEVTFRRPIERGQLVSWEAQKEIWDYTFFDGKTAQKNLLVANPEETTLVLTETPNAMPFLQKNADEIIMEEWAFGGYARVVGPGLNAYNNLHPLFGDPPATLALDDALPVPMDCLLVIDSGFSHTTITPLYRGKALQRAVRRLDFGGKHLTNLLKEIVSVRYFDLHQDVKVVNDIKEDICFVSEDFKADMEKTWKGNKGRKTLSNSYETVSAPDKDGAQTDAPQPLKDGDRGLFVDYILPDGIRLHRGFSRPHDALASRARKRKLNAAEPQSDEVSMTLGTERFAVPETLFSPSDVGSNQPGIAECVIQSMSVLPPALQACMLSNILVVGGTAKLPGFVERIQADVRMLAPADFVVRVRTMEDPITSTWLGGARLAANRDDLRKMAITKQEYSEHGSLWVGKKFMGGRADVK